MRQFFRPVLAAILILILTSFILPSLSSAGEKEAEDMFKLKPGQPIIVDGDKVEYFEQESKIVAEGNVRITYGDVKLKCDKIEVDTKSQKASCWGNVRIEHPEGVLTGDYIVYDLLNKKGEIAGAEVDAYPWFAKAEETKREGENEFSLKKGIFTTCDLDKPHYRIEAGEIRIFPDEKIMAKNAVMYVGDVPVMWFPYYYHPIIQSRAKVQLIPGSTSDWGYFLLTAWRFYIKGQTRVDVLLDYRTEKGFAEGANLYYDLADMGLKGLGKGLLRAYFIQQNDWGTYDPTPFRGDDTDVDKRHRVQWAHRIDLDPETVVMTEFNHLSDEYVIKDYFYNEYTETEQVPPNYLSVITSQENYILSLELAKRFNSFYTVTQKLPEISLAIPAQRMWDSPFYYSSDMSGTVFDKEYAYDNPGSEQVSRFDTFHRIIYVINAPFLNIAPYGSFRETLYSRDRSGEEAYARTALGAGVNLFTRFWKVFDVTTNAFGLDINGLRHVVAPNIDFYNIFDPSDHERDLYQMDDVDLIDRLNGLKMWIETKLQTKRHVGDKMQSVDLARVTLGTDYCYKERQDGDDFMEGGQFNFVDLTLELRPWRWLYLDSDVSFNPKNQALRKSSIEFALFPEKKLRMDFGYRYEKLTDTTRNQITFDVRYIINPKWRVEVYERINAFEGYIEEQQFTVVRDLHCWEVEFTYNLEGSNFLKDDYTVWVAFRIKAFPDLQLGLNRGFTKQAPGSSTEQAQEGEAAGDKQPADNTQQ